MLIHLLLVLFIGAGQTDLPSFALLRHWLGALFEQVNSSSFAFCTQNKTNMVEWPASKVNIVTIGYLHERKGVELRASHQSSVTSMVSIAFSSFIGVLRCSLACLISGPI